MPALSVTIGKLQVNMERYYAEYTASKAQEYNHLILKPEAIYKVIVLDSDGDTLYVWDGQKYEKLYYQYGYSQYWKLFPWMRN